MNCKNLVLTELVKDIINQSEERDNLNVIIYNTSIAQFRIIEHLLKEKEHHINIQYNLTRPKTNKKTYVINLDDFLRLRNIDPNYAFNDIPHQ